MPHFIMTLISIPVFYFLIGSNFFRLWNAGLIGIGIVLAADYSGYRLNLYQYQNGLITLGNWLPVFHIINMYLISMMYLNWLPKQWSKRIMYTVYFSAFALVIEAIMYRAGAIAYYNWKLWYSYFLTFVGLSLLAYLSDFVLKQQKPVS
jgi:hypothetical protein